MMAPDSDMNGGASEVADSASATFSLFAELRAWSPSLPRWERLALRILIEKGSVDEQDLEATYQALLVDNGLAEPQEAEASKDLGLDWIPESVESDRKVVLKRIQHVEGVNALVNGHYIDVGPNLTVVYGPNGSGKSGYARILKDSCFTRSRDRRVLGNVYSAGPELPTPRAVVTLAVNDREEDLAWHPGASLPLLRDYFVVFDTSCTRVSIDEQNVFITPYGFDVFPGLVDVCRRIREVLEQEIEQRAPDTEPLLPKEGTSRVSELLTGPSKDTPIEQLEQLAVFGEDEKKQLLALQKKVEELRKSDPAADIGRLEILMADLSLVKQKCEAASSGLSDDRAARIRSMATDLGKLQELSDAASALQFAREPVQPIGTDAWVQLVRAAVTYSAEAYPDSRYPADVKDPRCILCQQPLSGEARSRLTRFIEFVQSDVEQKVERKRRELEAAYLGVRTVDLSFFGPEAACRRSLDAHAPSLAGQVSMFVTQAAARRNGILRASTDQDWNALAVLPADLQTAVSTEIVDVGQQIRKLKETDIGERMSELVTEQQLLIHREHLSKVIEDVKKAVQDLAWIDKALVVKNGISHRHITERNKALIEELAGKSFLPELRRECEQIGAHVPLSIEITGSLGATSRKLGLNGASYPEAPSEVLSEGEQRAIAIADFLTEVGLSGNPAGVILDDPVCSLDHVRQKTIARRLVAEAKTRQVLIFTHDVLFTSYLLDAAEKAGVRVSAHTLSKGPVDGQPGYVDATAFPSVIGEKEALSMAASCVEAAKNLKGPKQDEQLRRACDLLRTAYEEFVQNRLFGGIVRRWEEQIRYQLHKVYFDHEIALEVQQHLEDLSAYIPAHSHSIASQQNPLTVATLEKELADFADVKGRYTKGRKKWEKEHGYED